MEASAPLLRFDEAKADVFSVGADDSEEMPVQEKLRVACHPDIGCGLALACVGGFCGACTTNDQCMSGEECVLERCLLEELVGCVTDQDCDAGEVCLLSGVSPGPRGNQDLHSYCMSERSGFEQEMTHEIETLQENIEDMPQFRMSSREALLREIHQQRGGEK